jgi:hypothetical protein
MTGDYYELRGGAGYIDKVIVDAMIPFDPLQEMMGLKIEEMKKILADKGAIMKKDEVRDEIEKILNLGSKVGRDLSETLKILKDELFSYGEKIVIEKNIKPVDEAFIHKYCESRGEDWNPVRLDFFVSDGWNKPRAKGSTCFYRFLQDYYKMGFVELLLDPETGGRTNNWDCAEVAMFNWVVHENFIRTEPEREELKEEQTEEQQIAALIEKIHDKKKKYVFKELSALNHSCAFHSICSSRLSLVDDLRICVYGDGKVISEETLKQYLERVEPELVKDGLGMKALIAVDSWHPVDHWVKDFISRFKAEQAHQTEQSLNMVEWLEAETKGKIQQDSDEEQRKYVEIIEILWTEPSFNGMFWSSQQYQRICFDLESANKFKGGLMVGGLDPERIILNVQKLPVIVGEDV